MKKILAFVLATIMVMSLVPASVFAIITDCPETHTVNNCVYKTLKEVDATCSKDGYSVLACEKCGTEFLGKFVEKIGHGIEVLTKTADGEAHKDIAGNCKTGEGAVQGIVWVECSYEGCPGIPGAKDCDSEDCEDDECEFQYIEVDAKHTIDAKKPIDGITGCLAQYECSVCKGKFYLNADGEAVGSTDEAHDYKYSYTYEEPVIPTEDKPGAPKNGKAVFACTKCNDSVYVTILASCTHEYENNEKYKAPTCVENGHNAKWTCKLCGEVIYTAGDKLDSGIKAEYEIKKLSENGHTFYPASDDHKLTFDATTCTWTGDCSVCGGKGVTNKGHHKDNVLLDEKNSKPATCAERGYNVFTCVNCKEAWVEHIEPLKHDVVTEVIPGTCTNKEVTLKLCKAEGCTTTKVTYNGKTTYAIGEGKDLVVYNIVGMVEGELDEDNHETYKTFLDASTRLNCAVSQTYLEKCDCGDYEVKIVTTKAGEHKFGDVLEVWYEYDAATGVRTKHYSKICSVCEGYFRTDGEWYNNDTHYLNKGEYLGEIITASQKTFDTLEEANIYHTFGWITKNVEVAIPGSDETEIKDIYNVSNSKLTLAENQTLAIKSTCTKQGYDVYTCADCDENFLVKAPLVKHELATKEFDEDGNCTNRWYEKAPTCTEVGYSKNAYTCANCDQIFVGDSSSPTGQGQKVIALSEITLPKHSQGQALRPIYDCSGEIVDYFYGCGGHYDANGKQQIGYWYANGKEFLPLTEFKGTVLADYTKDCAIAEVYAGKKAECEKEGELLIKWCKTCHKLEAYIITNINDSKVLYTAEGFPTASETKPTVDKGIMTYTVGEETKTISIVTPKHDHNNLAMADKFPYADHATHTDCDSTDALFAGHKCKFCDYMYIDGYVAAHQHVNKDGKALSDDCENKVIEDRKCIVANCIYKNGLAITAHQKANMYNVYDAGNCVEEGYNYWECKEGCGYSIIEVYTGDSDTGIEGEDHKAPTYPGKKPGDVVIAATYATNQYVLVKNGCTACKLEAEIKEVPNTAGTGFEIFIDTAVNGKADLNKATFGSIIEYTVSLASLKGVDVWGLNFDVTYTPTVLEFIGAEKSADSSFKKVEAYDVTKTETVGTGEEAKEVTKSVGLVTVFAHSELEAVKVSEETLVTLKFKVLVPVADEASLTAAPSLRPTTPVITNGINITINNIVATGEDLNVEEEDEVQWNLNADDGKVSIEFAEFCKLDGDKEFSVKDALAIYTIIKAPVNNEYNVAADIDANGVIEMKDLDLFYSLLKAEKTIAEVLGQNQ